MALEEAAYIAGDTLWDLSTSRVPTGIVGVAGGAYLGNKRLREETGLDLSRQVQKAFKKKGSVSRPTLDQSSRPNPNSNMGLLTYQRQVNTHGGRNKRRVRRIARRQRRARFAGCSNSLICNTFPLQYPAATGDGVREGLAQYAYYTPALAQVIEQASQVQSQSLGTGTGTDGGRVTQAYSLTIPKQRWEFTWTPDWPTHTATTALACKLTLYKFHLKKKLPINEVLSTPASTETGPDMGYYGTTNYVTSVPAGINGLPYDHVTGILTRWTATTNTAATPSATEWIETKCDPLSVFESPAMMSKLNFEYSKDFYIPYGQSMSYSCTHGGVNINYADMEINRPEKYVAKTATTNGDNFITPYLPRGWPVFIIKIQRHVASSSTSLTNFIAADAISVQHRMYYRLPNFPGRMLSFNTPSYSTSAGGVPRYSSIFGTANGTGKTSAYDGLNI